MWQIFAGVVLHVYLLVHGIFSIDRVQVVEVYLACVKTFAYPKFFEIMNDWDPYLTFLGIFFWAYNNSATF